MSLLFSCDLISFLVPACTLHAHLSYLYGISSTMSHSNTPNSKLEGQTAELSTRGERKVTSTFLPRATFLASGSQHISNFLASKEV